MQELSFFHLIYPSQFGRALSFYTAPQHTLENWHSWQDSSEQIMSQGRESAGEILGSSPSMWREVTKLFDSCRPPRMYGDALKMLEGIEHVFQDQKVMKFNKDNISIPTVIS